MKLENLKRMSAEELDEYAELLGINVGSFKKATSKADAIERNRKKMVTIKVAGLELEVEAKRIYDKEINDLLALYGNGKATDEDCLKALNILIGDEQMHEVVDACIDDDGMYDTAALAYIFTKVITSKELKKY